MFTFFRGRSYERITLDEIWEAGQFALHSELVKCDVTLRAQYLAKVIYDYATKPCFSRPNEVVNQSEVEQFDNHTLQHLHWLFGLVWEMVLATHIKMGHNSSAFWRTGQEGKMFREELRMEIVGVCSGLYDFLPILANVDNGYGDGSRHQSPALFKTRKFLLETLAEAWRDADNEEEADRVFALMTKPQKETWPSDYLKIVVEAIRAVTEKCSFARLQAALGIIEKKVKELSWGQCLGLIQVISISMVKSLVKHVDGQEKLTKGLTEIRLI